MALFGRGKRGRHAAEDADAEVDELDGAEGELDEGGEDADTTWAPSETTRPEGPWDVDDVPEDGPSRLDLGGLQVPLPEGGELRVEVSPEGEPYAATLVVAGSTMQVMAFAAPRSEGIWADVRSEIAAEVTGGGGTSTEVDGPFGVEIAAQVPSDAPTGRSLVPVRFVGVDGPRWFLRAALSGPAGFDAGAAEPLLAALRDVVVVRGGEAMVVRDRLPLRLPRDVQEAVEQQQAAQQSGGVPALPERGPEITEVR